MELVLVNLSDLQKLISEAVNKAFLENSKSPAETKNFLTCKQVLAKLQITYPTLKRYSDNGKFQKLKIGKKTVYDESQINNALTSFKRYDHNI